MSTNIFSTYSTGENRVTSTIIQVLKNLPLTIVEPFLEMFSGNPQQTFVKFENQAKAETTVPDAKISANFEFLIEVKTEENRIGKSQLDGHLAHAKHVQCTLVYLTPDWERPRELANEKTVVWKSFSDLHSLIDELLASRDIVVSDRDRFLLRNLQLMFEEEGLLPRKDSTLIVAASFAWDQYQDFGLYVCQANRAFRKVNYLGFYSGGYIQNRIAKVVKRLRSANLRQLPESTEVPDGFQDGVKRFLEKHDDKEFINENQQVFFLTGKDDQETKKLEQPIKNDLVSPNTGRGIAFTQGQRYVPLARLTGAKTTSEVVP